MRRLCFGAVIALAAVGAAAQAEPDLACVTLPGSAFFRGTEAAGAPGPLAFDVAGRARRGFDLAAGGPYTLVVVARGSPAAGAWPLLEVSLDGRRLLRSAVSTTNWASFTHTAEMQPGRHELEIAFLNDYWRPPEDRNLYVDSVTICSPPAAPAASALDAAGTESVHRELRARWTAEAEERIRQLRRGRLSVWVMNDQDRPATNATVAVRQVRHEFLFGTALSSEAFRSEFPSEETGRYLDTARRLFNHAVSENAMKWPPLEPRRDKPDYAMLDRMAGWCQTNRIPLRGHCLFWGCDLPSWTADLADQELRAAIQRRATRVASRYRERIAEFDVLNEPLHCRQLEQRLGESIAPMMFDWTHEANPDAVLYVNEYSILSGAESTLYEAFIQRLLDAGAKVGGIGIQGHFGEEADPLLMQRALDDLARFELPIKITEFDCGAPDEEEQARCLENVYRAAFSHPAVEGILMWGFWEKWHWKPEAALLRADFSAKPSAETYERLVFSNWWTRLEASVDRVGRCETPAFFGEYEIEARLDDGRSTNTMVQLTRALGSLSVTLRMPPPAPEKEPVEEEAEEDDGDEPADEEERPLAEDPEEETESSGETDDLPGISPDAF